MFDPGDCVLLSTSQSARFLEVRDVDGRQIQIQGVVKERRGPKHYLVRVMVELEGVYRGIVGVTAVLSVADLEPSSGLKVWNRKNARSLDRQRRGCEECPFWVN